MFTITTLCLHVKQIIGNSEDELLRGDRLREEREKLGITQRDLARACGLAENMVYRYENGLNDITGDSLKILAEQLRVSSDYLLGLSSNARGQLGDSTLAEDERDILDLYRKDGWSGLARLSVEKAIR